MSKFRKKPVTIEAEQYTKYGILVKGMCNSRSCFTEGNTKPHVHTIHYGQVVNLEIGDWVIPEPDGVHYYPIKPDILKNTYDELGTCTLDDEAGHMGQVVTDSDRLDKLQNLSDGYGTGWILRMSGNGRGMRLHESTHDAGNPDVRQAIDAYTPPEGGLFFRKTPTDG